LRKEAKSRRRIDPSTSAGAAGVACESPGFSRGVRPGHAGDRPGPGCGDNPGGELIFNDASVDNLSLIVR
jgi:hypothetical protein